MSVEGSLKPPSVSYMILNDLANQGRLPYSSWEEIQLQPISNDGILETGLERFDISVAFESEEYIDWARSLDPALRRQLFNDIIEWEMDQDLASIPPA